MIPIKYKNNTRFLVLGICGAIMAIFGYLMYTFNPIDAIVQSMITMSPSSYLFKVWTKPPFDILIKIKIFNVTNAEKFLAGKEKLNLEEIGPYSYQEELFNDEAVFNDNGTITFKPRRKLTFRPDKSVGSLEDVIISPNIPLLGISSHLKDASFFVNLAVAQIANMLDSPAFLNLTVEQYLWGYDDTLVDLAHKAIPSWINFERFGIMDRLMALDNASNVVTIKGDYPSENTDDQPYSIYEFNRSPGLEHWGYTKENTTCGNLKGKFVEGLFPRNMYTNVTIKLYRRAFCRPVDFVFEEHGELYGYETLNFRVDPLFLATKEEKPENGCYCVKGNCPRKGVSLLSPCYYGIPITISQPHFYNSDPELLGMVDGLSPDREEHDSTFMVHKHLGIPISAKLRIQINLNVDTKLSSRCRPFNGLTLPLFWLELNVSELPRLIRFALTMIERVLPVMHLILVWGFLLFGFAMVAASALFTFFAPTNYGLEDPFGDRVGYSPIRIIPMNPSMIRISK